MNTRVWPSLIVLALTGSLHTAAGQTVEFNRDIRPIFSENCFACHGPDKPKRKADLRLDNAEGAFADLGGHFALVPKKPGESALHQRLTEKDPRRRMPPASTGKSLSPQQVALIRRWIEQGAHYQKHWALIPPRRPDLPKIRDEKWVGNSIDRFLLARLERKGLKPSAEADRRVLLRRLSFDLTGLPPSPAEVDAFLADRSEKAYERVVARLLDSKHYGERMAMHWLDLVRYGDTGGYHSDNHRDIYLYRDYVIATFNANKRFDRFTIEQLAGDLLAIPVANASGSLSAEQRIASGYNRMLMTTEEGGAQAKEYLAKYAADRVRNASSVWLGLTMGCAECHNHKFDPITTKEFYRFAAFWADISEVAVGRQPQTKIPTGGQMLRLQAIDDDLARLRKTLDTPTPALAAGQKVWEERARNELAIAKPVWLAVKPEAVKSSGGATLVVQSDFSVLSTGQNPAKDTYTVTLKTDQKNITALRLAALRDPSLTAGGLSRGNGNFVLTGIRIELIGPDKKKVPVKLVRSEADFSQPAFPVASLLSRKGAGWAVEGHVHKNVDRTAMFVFARPLAGGAGTTLSVQLQHSSIYPQHNIGRFRLDLTGADRPALGDKAGLPDAVVQALLAESGKRSDAQKNSLAVYYRSIAGEMEPARRKIAELLREKDAIDKAMPQTLISMSMSPRAMRVLPRGNWLDDSGEIVAPGVPVSLSVPGPGTIVSGSPGKVEPRKTRLDLAKWLVAPEHPLTARVFVNRLWKLFFGQGIVSTLDDFGSQGAWPTHPDLLDWLAREFIESGWDVKHMVTLMVTSAAYRQSSTANETLMIRDPHNHWLGRQERFRLDAEFVRDNALAVSGLLSHKIGGPSVKPYQPAGYWAYLNFPTRDWYEDKGEDQHRRGLYTYWQRTFPHPSLLAFDAPSREECTVERPRSNTPQQGLVLLNDPTYVEAARALAEKTLREAGKSDAGRLDFAYRQVLGRRADTHEASVLLPLLERHLKQYRSDKEAANAILSVGQAPVGKDVDRPTLAAWTSVTRVLLNLHETITRE
jgi:mono/diheme cytochrome c family protein